MPQKLYVGNLSYRVTAHQIRDLFIPYSPVHSVTLISEKGSGRPCGYCFVELEGVQAEYAVDELKNKMFCGRRLRLSKAMGKKKR